MQSQQYQHNTNDKANCDHLANERCMMFPNLHLDKRSHCVVNLGYW
jgi:hypothetical protein